jgi:2-C-methyl-D-erythritol 4-phosphate cytidylyltransferase/2-C-methyl-D-erythritol 2,4-cyclodiphosphate synthase
MTAAFPSMKRGSSHRKVRPAARSRTDREPGKIAAVVAAGGQGTRIGSSLPKQFLELDGKPVLLRTVERILELDNLLQVVVAAPAGRLRDARAVLSQKSRQVPIIFVRGGRERQESVHRAVLRVRRDADLILVHDAVRPLCDLATMRRVIEAARLKGGAVPALSPSETIQRVSRRGWIIKTPPREELHSIQTPQCFHAAILRSALDRARKMGFVGTDESSVVRWAGRPVAVVPGSPDNIKITRPMDFEIAERLLAGQKKGGAALESAREGANVHRVGQGIDYHRLQEGRKLILGGVKVPFERGLAGHSDADVLSHAVCDALLGAAALGDIGRHFPDDDPRHRGRSSLEFLRDVRTLLDKAGWTIRNIDATLIAERPKLAPYYAAMRQNIAQSLGIPEGAIGIKATTSEGMNAEGRSEGMSAHAVALLEKTRS